MTSGDQSRLRWKCWKGRRHQGTFFSAAAGAGTATAGIGAGATATTGATGAATTGGGSATVAAVGWGPTQALRDLKTVSMKSACGQVLQPERSIVARRIRRTIGKPFPPNAARRRKASSPR